MIPFTDKGVVRVINTDGLADTDPFVGVHREFRKLVEGDNESLRHLLGTIERGCSWAVDLRGWTPSELEVVLLHCAILVRQDKGLG